MEIEKKNDMFFVSGDITESSDFSKIDHPKGQSKFEMSGVRSVNSPGVRAWVLWIKKHQVKATYVNCSQAVVMQFNMVRELLENGAMVESFQVPCYCETCGKEKTYVLTSGVDFQPGQPVTFEPKKCDQENCGIELDIDPESYFYFVESLLQ